MRKTTVGLIGAGVALAVALTGCSSSKKSGGGGSSGGKASGTIGVILPDTITSTRYTLYDAPLITKAITNAGYKADVQNAQGSNDKFASIAATMIGNGVKVLIIDPPDPSAGVSVEKKRRARASRSSTTTGSTSAARLTTTSPSTTRTSACSRARSAQVPHCGKERSEAGTDHPAQRRHRHRQQRHAVQERRQLGPEQGADRWHDQGGFVH
jgi:hypothetical protein